MVPYRCGTDQHTPPDSERNKVEMSTEIRITIYVRGRPHDILDDKISYHQVVNLGYPNGKHGPLYEYDCHVEGWPEGDARGHSQGRRDHANCKRHEIRCPLH